MNLPPVQEIPERIRGRSFVVVDVIHLGAPVEADALLAPLRALRPATDTVSMIPAPRSVTCTWTRAAASGAGDGALLAALPAEAIDRIVRVAGPGTGSPLVAVELRQIGGEMSRARPNNGAVAALTPGTRCSPEARRQPRKPSAPSSQPPLTSSRP